MRDFDGGTIAWRESGVGETVVFLHGLGGSRTAWDAQLEDLGSEFRCIAWDAPGYGASPPLHGSWTFPRLVQAVGGLLDALGEPAAHLVGLSLGGMVAQHVAVAQPDRVRSLTLISSSPAFGLDGETTPEEWRRARLGPLDEGREPADFAEQVIGSIAGPAIEPGALAGQCAAMARITGDALRQAIECLVTHDARAMLPRVTARTLVLVGELDEETPPSYARTIAGLVPGARLVVVPAAGHLLPAEAPAAVNALLRAHLRGAS